MFFYYEVKLALTGDLYHFTNWVRNFNGKTSAVIALIGFDAAHNFFCSACWFGAIPREHRTHLELKLETQLTLQLIYQLESIVLI